MPEQKDNVPEGSPIEITGTNERGETVKEAATLMSLEEGDKAAGQVQKPTHPRVTLADLEANIAAEYMFTGQEITERFGQPEHPSMGCLTICVLITKNGFTLIGKSAPADRANFDAELGRKFAREDAIRQLWPLMGYALRDKLHGA